MFDVTSDWDSRTIGELCRVTRGASPRPIQEWIAPTGTPWVKIADATATPSRVIASTREFIRDEGRKKSVVVYPGDLILSNSATPGIPKFMGIEACIHDGWLLLRELKDVDPLFLYYTFLNDRVHLAGQGNGSIFTNLKTEIVKRHRILVPPIAEQRAVAEVLGALDDKISANNKLINTADELCAALTRSALDSQASQSLSSIAVLTMGTSPAGTTFNEEGHGSVFYQGVRDFGVRFPRRRVWTTSPLRFAETGDCLLSVRAPVGQLNLASEKTCIGRGLASARSRDSRPKTLFHLLRDAPEIWAPYEAEGTIFGSINKMQLELIEVPTIVADRADHLEVQLAALEASIASALGEIELLTGTRDALLPQLMSGKLRVKDAEKVLEGVF
jgi:type I restriction enzyme S subunit